MMRPLFNKARQFRTVKPSNCDAAKAVLVDRQNLSKDIKSPLKGAFCKQ
jgi:hypothetical protein